MKRLLAVLFCAALLCGCAALDAAQDGDEPATQPPLTLDFPDPAEAPTTQPPATEAPTMRWTDIRKMPMGIPNTQTVFTIIKGLANFSVLL